MDGWTNGRMDGRTDGRIGGSARICSNLLGSAWICMGRSGWIWLAGWMDGWTDGRTDGWMDGWMRMDGATGVVGLTPWSVPYVTYLTHQELVTFCRGSDNGEPATTSVAKWIPSLSPTFCWGRVPIPEHSANNQTSCADSCVPPGNPLTI